MSPRRDPGRWRSGVTDLPLKIAVTALVLAVMIPTVWSSVDTMCRDHVRGDTAALAARIRRCGLAVMDGAPGTSMVLEFELPSSGRARLDRVVLGDELRGGNVDIMRFYYSFETRERSAYMDVPMSHPDGHRGVGLNSTGRIRMTHARIDGVSFVAIQPA